MYLPSNTPLLHGQRDCAARKQAGSAQRVAATRETMAGGRVAVFETIVSPQDILAGLGIGVAVNVQKLQDQTLAARASAFLGLEPDEEGGPTYTDLIASAPKVVSLNRQPGQMCSDVVFQAQLVGPDPTPTMPHGAPNIVPTEWGPMYFRGKDATYPGAYPSVTGGAPVPEATRVMKYMGYSGLTGVDPPWSDAWLMPQSDVNGAPDSGVGQWISEHPWLALVIAGAGVFALSKGTKGRR
jgi:hypothetical protein